MGGVGRVACQGFLVREARVMFWWVELDFFSLECDGVPSNEFEMGLCVRCDFGQPVC